MSKPRRKKLWTGWYFDGTHLVDPFGNQFTEQSIYKFMGRRMPESWNGWSFHDDLLYAPNGMPYKKEEIAELDWMRPMILHNVGKPNCINSLKRHLDRKIKELDREVKISIQYGDRLKEFSVKVC